MPAPREIVSELKYARHPSSIDYNRRLPTTNSSGDKGLYLMTEGQKGSAIYKSPRFSWPDDANENSTACFSFQTYMGGSREVELELFILNTDKRNLQQESPKLIKHISPTSFKGNQWEQVTIRK